MCIMPYSIGSSLIYTFERDIIQYDNLMHKIEKFIYTYYKKDTNV